MKRTASAVWNGTLKQGNGTVSTPNGTLKNVPYTFASRFESGTGTNPEELIGAAHSGCFVMALSGILEKAGFQPERLEESHGANHTRPRAGDQVDRASGPP